MRKDLQNTHKKKDKGFSLLEVMVSICYIALMGFTILTASVTSVKFQKLSEIGNAAMNMAMSKAEELSGVALTSLDDSYDETESDISTDDHNILFQRVTNITVNADGSRTVEITVSSSSKYLPNPIVYNTTFALW